MKRFLIPARLLLPLGLGALATLALLVLLWRLSGPPVARADPGARYVAPAGLDAGNDCSDSSRPCATIQHAVDTAVPGDVIKIASGVYTNVQGRGAQVVHLSKSLILRGGYTTAFTDPPDPDANPTTLDAQGRGRVLLITAPAPGAGISPTIEGLRITGGDMTDLAGELFESSDGGGVYAINVAVTMSDCHVFGNTGLANGGGLYLYESTLVLNGSVISDNHAESGGGLCLQYSSATLNNNTISHNRGYDDAGGGLWLYYSAAVLVGNIISANVAGDGGGGLHLFASDATLISNTISANIGGYDGGGLGLRRSHAILIGNFVSANTADDGGGLRLDDSTATLNGNIVSGNHAYDEGGGLYLSSSAATLTNTIVTDNQAGTGSGMYIGGSSPRLLHTTLARNRGGDGSGIYVTGCTVALTNTILVSQTRGINVTAGSTATLEGTLWGGGAWANSADWAGAGTILTGTVNLWGDPDFLNPDKGDYHIGSGSAAIDAGVDAGIIIDIDSDPRPWGAGYDVGADEYRPNQAPYIPSHPTPAHGATGVPLTQTLSWRGGDPDGDPVTYAIAFDTSDPPSLIATTPLTGYTPALVAGTTYYWTVSASDGVSLSLGPLWRFTTRYALYLPLLLHRFP